MMPMQSSDAAMQMLIEQVRRLSDSVDRFNTTMSGVQQQLARMEKENEHTIERQEKNEAWLARIENRVDRLESWQSEQKGERGFLSALIKSPIFAYIAGAVMSALAVLKGGFLK